MPADASNKYDNSCLIMYVGDNCLCRIHERYFTSPAKCPGPEVKIADHKTALPAAIAAVRWKKEPPPRIPAQKRQPYTTHSGTIVLEGMELRVFKLSTGQTVVSQEDMERFMRAMGLVVSPESRRPAGELE